MIKKISCLITTMVILAQAGFTVFVPMELGENLPNILEFEAPYEGEKSYNLVVKPDRRSDEFELRVQNDAGGYEITEPPSMKAYRGYAKEDTKQRVVATVRTGGVEVYYLDTPPERSVKLTDWYIIDFAMDVDNVYYEDAGNNLDSVMMRIDKNMALMHEVYERDLQAIFNTKFIVLRASKVSCPYRNHVPYTKRVIDRMKWMIGFWKKDFDEEAYDVAHVITSVGAGSGVASRGSFCEPGGVVADNPHGKYAGNSITSDTDDFEFYGIFRHEMGHSFGAKDHYTGESPDGPTIMWGNDKDFFAEVVMQEQMIPVLEAAECVEKLQTPIFDFNHEVHTKSGLKIDTKLSGNRLTLQMQGTAFSARLFDMKGRLIRTFAKQPISSNPAVLRLSEGGKELAAGEYLLNIILDGKSVAKKIRFIQ